MNIPEKKGFDDFLTAFISKITIIPEILIQNLWVLNDFVEK